MEEIASRNPSHGRVYSEEEIWYNFKYFLDRTLPVCEKAGVKMALHPNDPPAACVMLVRCDCDALISVDHASHGVPEFGGMAGAYGYSTGYMKGMLMAAEKEVAVERRR